MNTSKESKNSLKNMTSSWLEFKLDHIPKVERDIQFMRVVKLFVNACEKRRFFVSFHPAITKGHKHIASTCATKSN